MAWGKHSLRQENGRERTLSKSKTTNIEIPVTVRFNPFILSHPMSLTTVMLASLAALLVCLTQGQGNWNEWWTYDGISGPAYWGLINPAWTMCNKVRKQLRRGFVLFRILLNFLRSHY